MLWSDSGVEGFVFRSYTCKSHEHKEWVGGVGGQVGVKSWTILREGIAVLE